MKKIKLLFVALLSCFCCFAFSGCSWLIFSGDITMLFLAWAFNEVDPTPTYEERRMMTEITEGMVITEITQDEDGWYVTKAEGAIKNLGDKDGEEGSYRVSFYDENGYLLETVADYVEYIGVGDTYKVECEATTYYKPATARIYNVELYSVYDDSYDKEGKEEVEVLAGETFACTLGEDGLYRATVTGQVKLLPEATDTVRVVVAFYDADGYLYVREWSKSVLGPAERTYEVECISDTEIVSYKVLYGTTW